MSQALRVAFYGKGGVGKSTVAAHVSAYLAMKGRSILHVGCDPKRDSTLRLIEPPQRARPVLETMRGRLDAPRLDELLTIGRRGISCCESGGPPPGAGCGGRGVARTIELLQEAGALEPGRFDATVFDVLGDVVCGGFGAPLRQGVGELVVIVVSEEPMALLAANNIARAVVTHGSNGISLAGLVANLRGGESTAQNVEALARELSTPVLAVIPRHQGIQQSERLRQTVFDADSDDDAGTPFAALAEHLWALDRARLTVPTPLDDDRILEFLASSR